MIEVSAGLIFRGGKLLITQRPQDGHLGGLWEFPGGKREPGESFEECLVRVVNRGGDADTTGAIAGQLAGALYGVHGIPNRWLKKLDPKVTDAIYNQIPKLLNLSTP